MKKTFVLSSVQQHYGLGCLTNTAEHVLVTTPIEQKAWCVTYLQVVTLFTSLIDFLFLFLLNKYTKGCLILKRPFVLF